MKQTNRAITFLMAQYRAVFKHAYVKGLVSVAVLSGLAGSAYADAATPANFTEIDDSGYQVVITDTTADEHKIDITNGLLVSGGSLTISAAPTYYDPSTKKEIDEVGTFTLKSNSTTELHDSIKVTQGVLNVEANAGLYAATAANNNTSGSIVVNGGKSGIMLSSDLPKDTASIRISSADLNKFLEGGQKYQQITYNNEGEEESISRENQANSVSGSLVLTSGGRLLLTDEKIDLTTAFNFAETNAASANGSAGKIVFTVKGTPGIISGSNITISDVLRSEQDKPTAVTEKLNLNVETDNLVLGSDTYSGTGSFMLQGIKASDSVTFKVKDSTFTLSDTLYLDRPYFAQEQVANTNSYLNTLNENTAGQIIGDVNIKGANDQPVFAIDHGTWESSNSITVTNGTLQIGAPTNAAEANDASEIDSTATYNNDGRFALP